ncbi:LytR C-terminal domain-containing protein [Cellulomonas sp. C5510]|uniref:LytR C-terminal domain-containing protein n=1 Tax=Cellulomonas sp. C5510 TaxID=2871170 RepID=UPI001C9708F0|nr:LytR C-terminal domain-containing protein [Cellulomonas sp. C5510]QZN86107.1 LytR C-terminal domain-containing protein [Cellulomonas sp. C5510]
MTKASSRFPEDEFDAGPAMDAPIGVHRAPRSWWSRWWPFVAVIVVVPALTVSAVLWAASWDGTLPVIGRGDDTNASAPPPSSPSASPDDTGAAPTEETSEEPPADEVPPPAPDLSVPVRVLNAANISGLAGGAAEQLEGAGFTDVTAGNGNAGGSTASTVFYANADLAVTAQQVAATLGLTNVVESAEVADQGVVVLLLADFAG